MATSVRSFQLVLVPLLLFATLQSIFASASALPCSNESVLCDDTVFVPNTLTNKAFLLDLDEFHDKDVSIEVTTCHSETTSDTSISVFDRCPFSESSSAFVRNNHD